MENQDEIKKLLADADQLIKNGKEFLAEDNEMKRCINFALNEWKTNKRWFREEPGHVTTEDVIKMCIQYGWACKRQYDYSKQGEQLNQ